ncbi:extracellular catalytic domain type 1 short-chain-length polyhydroxyalkanoate depolymerase [Thiocystis violascens]|uniref:Esterase, PHB depolymerase family n=1 Tax=Thiocystis violascens (strain ATCC 17096 / DSM 198 / 6111) TaxID=765911 RepID=I3Y7Q8_THIV6|nr:PHB depolymerase family esterase [Thiocystis violascens]AFL73026.1 esterase, PHB depolymerase family [Thiocystis violascens DSM 198]
MKDAVRIAMIEATRLTQAGRLADATDLIKSALAGVPKPADGFRLEANAGADLAVIEGDFEVVDDGNRVRDARFIHGSFANQAGTRDYKLYIPGDAVTGDRNQRRFLVVMLHGCGQDPDDFATGTRMNQLAEEQGGLVLYPAQSASANGSGCWNWFNEADQQRGQGEPSIIADLTRQVMASHGIDPGRVYVAGLSAGGAMAITLAVTYPDLYAAVGVHSGLPHAAARDMLSAVGAMRQGAIRSGWLLPSHDGAAFPVIVFHGDCDTTVNPANAAHVIAQARSHPSGIGHLSFPDGEVLLEQGRIPGGYAFTRTLYQDAEGRSTAILWMVHGAGHGWFGGSGAGSYTEPRGPDASREMLRFFAGQRLRER